MEIPNGYRLMVLDPAGTILDVIDLDGRDLRHTLAAVDLAADVAGTVEQAERVKQ